MRWRKPITVSLLIIAALFIWGYNAWQVIEVVGTQSTGSQLLQNSNTIESMHIPTPKVLHVYSPTARDPFNSHLSDMETSQVDDKDLTHEENIVLPDITYKGMIGNTAVVIDQFGDQFFLKRNSRMGEVTIVRIGTDQLSVEYRGKLFDVSLN